MLQLRDSRACVVVAQVGAVPVVHGSALFSRGESQVLATATVGGRDDAMRSLLPEPPKTFFAHYTFPAFAVNQARNMQCGSSVRRVAL